MSLSVKTRFAPSPTGDLHIGGLRTALFAYLFAKKNQGQFFLRIEDTDQSRYKEGSVESIIEGLKWVGIEWDTLKSKIQNPKSKINSNFQIQNLKQDYSGIWFQSERIEVYKKYADELVKAGHAYHCFCTPECLEEMRRSQKKLGVITKYDETCRNLNQEEIQKNLNAKKLYVIRMKIPKYESDKIPGRDKENSIKFKDLIRGYVEFYRYALDDQILLKSDGFPTYHLANVVDDHEMGITHVIRAEEWLASTPKHIILYQMFGWEIPEFAHLSMILAPDKSKLSKRHGATSVLEFKNLGYLPEAVVNYIALLGWNPGTEQEIFSLKELEQAFDLDKVNKAGAVFDIEKLNWLNGHYLRGKNHDELVNLCLRHLIKAGYIDDELRIMNNELRGKLKGGLEYIKTVVELEQERLKKLSEIEGRTRYFFKRPSVDPKMLVWKKSTPEEAKSRLEFLVEFLSAAPEENWTRATLEETLLEEIKIRGFGNGDTLWPMRVALSGEERSPSPFEIAEVLGKEETLERLKLAHNIMN